jgi:hypothetical protein
MRPSGITPNVTSDEESGADWGLVLRYVIDADESLLRRSGQRKHSLANDLHLNYSVKPLQWYLAGDLRIDDKQLISSGGGLGRRSGSVR